MVTVLGASGFLGSHATRSLLAHGVDVRAVVRRPRASLRGVVLERVAADLSRPETLRSALRGSDVVVHAAAPYPRTSLEPERTLAAALAETEGVLDAVARSRARRLVFVSSSATVAPAVGRPSDERDVWTGPPGLGTYHDLKWALEDRVRREDRFEVVIACPSGCLGPGDWRVGTSAWLVACARGLPCPHPEGLVSLVDARDVGEALASLALHPAPPGRLILSATTLPLRPLLLALCARYGAPDPAPALGDDEARALADAAERRALATGVRPELPRELVDLVIAGAPISGALAERLLGLSWTPLSRTLDDFDAWARRAGLLPRTHHLEPRP